MAYVAIAVSVAALAVAVFRGRDRKVAEWKWRIGELANRQGELRYRLSRVEDEVFIKVRRHLEEGEGLPGSAKSMGKQSNGGDVSVG